MGVPVYCNQGTLLCTIGARTARWSPHEGRTSSNGLQHEHCPDGRAQFLVAFSCALSLSYLLNRAWTYQARGRHRRQLPRFAVVCFAGYGLNAAIMALVTNLFGLSYLFGIAVVVMVLPSLSFLSHRYWTFVDERKVETVAR